MNYLECAKKIYEKLETTDFLKLISNFSQDYDRVVATLNSEFRFDELRKSYINDIKYTIDKYLYFFKNDLERFFQIDEIKHYLRNIATNNAAHLYWIWDKKINISKNNLRNFIDSLFLGTFGYKMIDHSADSKNPLPELNLVGFYAVKLAEKLLAESLGQRNTQDPMEKYFKKYVEIEIFEKKNRWKQCPFSWDQVAMLGSKIAPILTVFESLFNLAGFSEVKSNDLIEAITYSTSVTQIVDDLSDAKYDLSNGYETLVMKGFYEHFGSQTEITDEKINLFLSQERLKHIYAEGLKLYEKSRKILEKHNEYIIQFQVELHNLNFLNLFEIK
jgi:hypothetical protein